jgi:hypothetical protein
MVWELASRLQAGFDITTAGLLFAFFRSGSDGIGMITSTVSVSFSPLIRYLALHSSLLFSDKNLLMLTIGYFSIGSETKAVLSRFSGNIATP